MRSAHFRSDLETSKILPLTGSQVQFYSDDYLCHFGEVHHPTIKSDKEEFYYFRAWNFTLRTFRFNKRLKKGVSPFQFQNKLKRKIEHDFPK